jgi:DNA primase
VSGRIADEAIRAVRDRVRIAELVGESVSLKRRGRSMVGLCPFHAERTPSFTVNEEGGFFHCFGCGEHGDAFAFVMKTRGLTFPEAVEQLAERVGVELPRQEGGGEPRTGTAALWDVHRVAQAFYQSALAARSGERARVYLAERGVSRASIERFGVGWAPQTGDALVRHLEGQGVGLDAAQQAGLVLQGRRGPYDRFRGRVTFPIADSSGRVAAFGGRVLPELAQGDDPPPKYVNSAESPIFHKGRMLYGLGLAREAIRATGRVLVVEGYLDVVALAQHGIEEVVAPLGTALTADQLRVLRRFTDRVVACFDGDAAGRRAAARSFTTFVEAGLWGHAAFLPAGEDPDSFVRTEGPDRLRELIDAPTPLVETFVRSLAGPRPDATARHADAAREVVRVLAQLSDPLEREPLVRLAAHYLGVREETLDALGSPPGAPARRPVSTPVAERAANGAEELLVELLFVDPALADTVGRDRVLDAIEEPTLHAVAERLLVSADADRTGALEILPPDLRDRVARRLVAEGDESEDRARMLMDCVNAIRQRRDGARQRALRLRLQEAERRGDADAVAAAQHALNTFLTERASR